MPEVLRMFTDGGARGNPGPAAVGIVIKDMTGKVICRFGKYIGRSTNNIAEYTAVIEALTWIKNQPAEKTQKLRFQFYLDSQLVVNQLNGLYKIKNERLRGLIIQVRDLEKKIKKEISYNLIPRKDNFLADNILNQILQKNRP